MAEVIFDVTKASTILLTENKKGFMIQYLDPYCEDFIDHVTVAPKPLLVADFGVAYGKQFSSPSEIDIQLFVN
jgi:hypothetical protein